MSNHLHMIARSNGKNSLSDILRDFKKFTSKELVKQIIDQHGSRRRWILRYFAYSGKYLKRVEGYKLWQDGNQAQLIYSSMFFYQKLNYIHQNPVKELVVFHPEDYLFSSARNYAGLDSLLDIIIESHQLITYWKVRVINALLESTRYKRALTSKLRVRKQAMKARVTNARQLYKWWVTRRNRIWQNICIQ